MSRWTTACPLAGRCTECGLEIEWHELLSAERALPRWCVEFARSRRDLLVRSITTFAMTWAPMRFWRTLRMSDEPQWRRIAVYLLIMAAGLYLTFCLTHAACAAATWSRFWPFPVRPPNAQGASWVDVVRAAVLPFSRERPSYSNLGRAVVAPSPADLARSRLFIVTPALAFAAIFHTMCSVGFLALPVSRRRAKVRWRHIHRVTLYGVAIFVPPVVLTLVSDPLDAQRSPVLRSLGAYGHFAALIAMFGAVPLEILWWSCATGRYMRIKHAAAVGFSIVVMALLTSALIFVALGLLFNAP